MYFQNDTVINVLILIYINNARGLHGSRDENTPP